MSLFSAEQVFTRNKPNCIKVENRAISWIGNLDVAKKLYPEVEINEISNWISPMFNIVTIDKIYDESIYWVDNHINLNSKTLKLEHNNKEIEGFEFIDEFKSDNFESKILDKSESNYIVSVEDQEIIPEINKMLKKNKINPTIYLILKTKIDDNLIQDLTSITYNCSVGINTDNNLNLLSKNGITLSCYLEEINDISYQWDWIKNSIDNGISSRSAYLSATRGALRILNDYEGGQLNVGSMANLLFINANFQNNSINPTIARWSTDTRSGMPDLPNFFGEAPKIISVMRAGEIIESK